MVSDRPLRPLRLLCKKVPIARGRRVSFKQKGVRQVGTNRHSIGMRTSLNSYVILVRISTRDPHTIGQYQTGELPPRAWSNGLSVKDTHYPWFDSLVQSLVIWVSTKLAKQHWLTVIMKHCRGFAVTSQYSQYLGNYHGNRGNYRVI